MRLIQNYAHFNSVMHISDTYCLNWWRPGLRVKMNEKKIWVEILWWYEKWKMYSRTYTMKHQKNQFNLEVNSYRQVIQHWVDFGPLTKETVLRILNFTVHLIFPTIKFQLISCDHFYKYNIPPPSKFFYSASIFIHSDPSYLGLGGKWCSKSSRFVLKVENLVHIKRMNHIYKNNGLLVLQIINWFRLLTRMTAAFTDWQLDFLTDVVCQTKSVFARFHRLSFKCLNITTFF